MKEKDGGWGVGDDGEMEAQRRSKEGRWGGEGNREM